MGAEGVSEQAFLLVAEAEKAAAESSAVLF
jgi:hypothetical protein